MVPTNTGQLGQATGCIVTLLISGVCFPDGLCIWIGCFISQYPALSFAGCDLMPGAGGARVVQNSRHWTSLVLVPAFLYSFCFSLLSASPPQPWAATGISQLYFFPIGTEYIEQRMSVLACLTHQHTVKSAVLPLKHPLRQ